MSPPSCPPPSHRSGRRRVVTAVAGALVATGVQLVALVSRTEAWHVCVTAAGGHAGRRRLYRAASVGYVASQVSHHLGAAARIAVLRRSAPEECPRVPALVAAEVPILTIEGVLAALTSFTLVGPLGLPWWLPLVLLAGAGLLVAGLGNVANRWREGLWSGLAVLRSVRGGAGVVALVLIAMVAISGLPVGPSVGAAAVVVILGADGVALAAAAGVLLTATGTAGAIAYAAWAATDRLWTLRPQVPVPTQPAMGGIR